MSHFLWWVLLSLCGLIAVVLVIISLLLRRRSPAGRTPIEVSLLAEAAVDRALRRAGVARPPWQPLPLFIGELVDRMEESSVPLRVDELYIVDQLRSLLADAATAAVSAEHALYHPDHVDPNSAIAAHHAANRVRRGLRSRDLRRLLSGGVNVATLADSHAQEENIVRP